MRFSLWKQVALSLLIPIIIASAIVLYAVYNLKTISNRINFIELADDINITLLELRRFEKNILLFKDNTNIDNFHKYLAVLEDKIHLAEKEIIEEINKQKYSPLIDNIRTYKESASTLISSVQKELTLVADIRPLGRLIEKQADSKDKAFELRRYEKNYIIYGEPKDIHLLHVAAEKLTRSHPELTLPVSNYTSMFDALVETEVLKENSAEKMRLAGIAIEKVTKEFSDKKRKAIENTLSTSMNLLVSSLVILLVSTVIISRYFSSNVVTTIKTIERSLDRRVRHGDFTRGVTINRDRTPEEITSFVNTYNQVIEDLGISKSELDRTVRQLEGVNAELIEKQDELVETRKLAALKLLASEIAHEINNPLSSISLFLGVLYEEMREDDPKKEFFEIMMKETKRCQAVVRELADFAKKEPLKLKEVDPAEIIKEAAKVVTRQNSKNHISLSLSLDDLPRRSLIDPILFYQAIVNIVSNAYEFSRAGLISVYGISDNGNMEILIQDQGEGIPEENLELVFEPFFSTRKESGGSGLGLAITRKIIEKHNGRISVSSSPGKGTAFRIIMPVSVNAP